ncbi:MAG: hypothetical protein HUK15_01960 [Bacteroidales bacterium]|nr:hypothetical protein [Bacteroidales bacterium]
MMLIAVFAISSCNSVSNVMSSDTAAKTMGTTCGASLSNLYKTYKSSGKLSITDSNVLNNVFAISSSTMNLKENAKNSAYRTSYISGLVAGSAGLLTETKAANVYNKLVSTNEAISSVNSSSSENKLLSAVNAITTILQLF